MIDDNRLIEIVDSVLQFGVEQTSVSHQISQNTIRRYIHYYRTSALANDETVRELLYKSSRSIQKYKDKQRIESKIKREDYRTVNAIEEYQQALIAEIKKHNFSERTKKHKVEKRGAAGIVQISDTHFNELIDVEGNKYNFEIAGKRLALFADNIRKIFGAYEVKNILLAMTGDLLNSDRRLDELLSQATNRAKASIASVDLLRQFVLDLNRDYNISIVSVTGNESRITQERGWAKAVASDNYDYTIPAILRMLFEGSDGVVFGEIDGNETVAKVNGKNILVTHGEAIKGRTHTTAQQMVGRYALKGVQIDYIIHGHLHSSHLGDIQGRSASLAGGNAYSEHGLNLHGRAGQNIYVIDGGIHAMSIDLQDASTAAGYAVNVEDAYNPKSTDKARTKTKIIEVGV